MTGLARQRSLISPATRWFRVPGRFALESGATLEAVEVAYRTWGTLNAGGTNAVLICHALSASADADDWWGGLIGAGRALDPDHDFIICSNVLGGCYGTTGPLSLRPGTNRKYGSAFPHITVRDMVSLQRLLIAELGVDRLALVLGPSLGAMQALEWALGDPQSVAAIAPIGVGARHSAWCVGMSETQRQAIYTDPNWCGGDYSDDSPPEAGLAAARMMAMLSYRSWQTFEQRFGRERRPDGRFEVQSYLEHQGRKLNARFDAMSYVRLTQAMNSHDVARGRGDYLDVLAALNVAALVVSISSDILYPPHEQVELANALPRAQYRVLESPHGHDGFLIEVDALGALIAEFRRSG